MLSAFYLYMGILIPFLFLFASFKVNMLFYECLNIFLPVVLSFCYNAGQDEREQDSY